MSSRRKPIASSDAVTAMPRGNHCFVFVVCGSDEHIDTLHYSLTALQRHSRADITVVTDSRRNHKTIRWPHVVDVATPPHLNHHQASIFLKTGVHRFVPPGPRYCYLDTDVVAVDRSVDDVFRTAPAPVRFAADHIGLRQFSPYAVRCTCEERHARDLVEITNLKKAAYDSGLAHEPRPSLCRTPADYEQRAANLFVRWQTRMRFATSRPSLSQRGDPLRRRWQRYWIESQANSRWEPPAIVERIEQTTRWRRDERRQSWINPVGEDIYLLACDHLVKQIATTFGIAVTRPNWQHWNGGVFLFDEGSRSFLDAWHAKTMRIFTDAAWRTRDQGTLIATVWEFGLQHLTPLPSRFNCITDPHIGGLMVSADGQALSLDGFLTRERPALVHVMYRFGDPTWDVWNWVASRATEATGCR